jgi:hypothetical protein
MVAKKRRIMMPKTDEGSLDGNGWSKKETIIAIEVRAVERKLIGLRGKKKRHTTGKQNTLSDFLPSRKDIHAAIRCTIF